MSMFGKIVHLAADAILVSAVLAGIKRSSGLSINAEVVSSESTRPYLLRYLDMGEWILDQSIFFMSSSKYFTRNR